MLYCLGGYFYRGNILKTFDSNSEIRQNIHSQPYFDRIHTKNLSLQKTSIVPFLSFKKAANSRIQKTTNKE